MQTNKGYAAKFESNGISGRMKGSGSVERFDRHKPAR
jgi:hypothetical protein